MVDRLFHDLLKNQSKPVRTSLLWFKREIFGMTLTYTRMIGQIRIRPIICFKDNHLFNIGSLKNYVIFQRNDLWTRKTVSALSHPNK